MKKTNCFIFLIFVLMGVSGAFLLGCDRDEARPAEHVHAAADIHDHEGESGENHAHEHADTPAQHAHVESSVNGSNEPQVVRITKEQADQFGIRVAEASYGSISRIIRAPGEFRLNEERMTRVVAQLSGIVRSAPVKVGDAVRAGQILAVLESRDLAEAKAAFLAAEKRERLAREFFEREERLWEKKVTSENEYLTARQALDERSIEKASARQQLLAIGVPQESIGNISETASSPLSRFEFRAPIAGRVLEKHLTLGESVQSGKDMYVIADMSTVWLDLSVGHENLAELREGLPIEIEVTGGQSIDAEIAFVSPVVDHETRTALVRAVVQNGNGSLRPGLFVQAGVRLSSQEAALLVPKGAIQMVNDHPCVFVWNNGAFEIREVVPGESDDSRTEILNGLRAGERVVAENAFHLKAEYIKSAAGDQGAHHGHSH